MDREAAWRRAIDVVADISIPDPLRDFKIVAQPHESGGLELVMTMEAKDREVPTENITIVDQHVVSRGEIEHPDVAQTLLWAARAMAHKLACHEVDEWLHYNRKRINDPHA